MHEGALSLMQMAKSCAALQRLHASGGLYVSLMAHPTTGGVTASWATMADILLAEPRALIGFAGPRVIKTTIGQDLPEGFQTAEFLMEKGQIDRIVERKNFVQTVDQIFHYCLGPARPVDRSGRRKQETAEVSPSAPDLSPAAEVAVKQAPSKRGSRKPEPTVEEAADRTEKKPGTKSREASEAAPAPEDRNTKARAAGAASRSRRGRSSP